MYIIRPVTIRDDMLIDTNVAEADASEWNAAVTYNNGARVIVTSKTKTGSVSSSYLSYYRANLVAGNAFFMANGIDLSDYVGTDEGSTPFAIELTDSAGKKATGYIGASGTGTQGMLGGHVYTVKTEAVYMPSFSSAYWLKSPGVSPSVSPSLSPSKSYSPSVSPSRSPSVSPSASPSEHVPAESASLSPSASRSPSKSPSTSPSLSPSSSISPSASPSEDREPWQTPSPSVSPSVSPSASPTDVSSESPSISPSESPSASTTGSPSSSLSPSASISPSASPSISPSASPSFSPSESESGWTLVGGKAIAYNGYVIYLDEFLVSGQLYYATLNITARNSGGVSIFMGTEDHYFKLREAVDDPEKLVYEYACPTGGLDFGLNGFGTADLTVDSITLYKVLEPYYADFGGVHVMSEINGTYQSWESVESGFDAAKIASYYIYNAERYHKLYECLTDANINKFPPDYDGGDVPDWLELHTTNRWRVFDSYIQTQTTNDDSLYYVLAPGSIDSIGIFNIDATEISITMVNDGEVIYSYSLVLNGLLNVHKMDIPTGYDDAQITIMFTGSGTLGVGAIVLGAKYYLGITLYSPELGIEDYSVKEADDFGNYTFVERTYSMSGDFEILVPNTIVDDVFDMLVLYRATPAVYVGDTVRASFIVYGYRKDFSIVMDSPDYSHLTLQVVSLT